MLLSFTLLKILFGAIAILISCAYLIRLERQVFGKLGLHGDSRWGALWPLVDMARALSRRGAPWKGRPTLRYAASALSLAFALFAVALMPLGATMSLRGWTVSLWLLNPPMSLPIALTLSALSGVGALLGAWEGCSDDLWVEARAVAQHALVYTLPALLAIAGIVMLSGSFNIVEIVRTQRSAPPYALYQPLGMVLLAASLLIGGRRLPYRLPSGQSPLLSDFHLQHAGSALAQYHLAEYVHLAFVSLLIANLYLGGWYGPWLAGPHWVVLKAAGIATSLLWLRSNWLPYQHSRLSERYWLVLMLLAAFNALLTGVLLAWRR